MFAYVSASTDNIIHVELNILFSPQIFTVVDNYGRLLTILYRIEILSYCTTLWIKIIEKVKGNKSVRMHSIKILLMTVNIYAIITYIHYMCQTK